MSVLDRAGKSQRRTGSALTSPRSLCSARGWLTSRRSAQKNSGIRPAGRGIPKIAAPQLQNNLVKHPCSLPGPAETRMFPVGIAVGSPTPLKVRGSPVQLGSTRLLLTVSGRFLLRKGSALPIRSQLCSVQGSNLCNLLPLKMVDRFLKSTDSDVSTLHPGRSCLARIGCKMTRLIRVGSFLLDMESEIQKHGLLRSGRGSHPCNPTDHS